MLLPSIEMLRELTKYKLFKFTTAFLPLFISLIVLFSIDAKNYFYSVIGGALGCFYSLCVITTYHLSPKDVGVPPFAVLYWRSVCDLGLGIRFIFINAFNVYLCGSYECVRSASDPTNCSLPSALLEFFTIASECWLLCNGLDLFFSITNPFSSFKERMVNYHIATWSFSILFSLFPLFTKHSSSIYGFFSIDHNDNDLTFCWITVHSSFLTWPIWVMYFIPILIVYLTCLVTLNIAYRRLKKGISRSFLPKIKLLITNTTNVICQLLYWLIIAFFYSIIYGLSSSTSSHRLGNFLQFVIASKGFSAYVVLVLVSDIRELTIVDTENILQCKTADRGSSDSAVSSVANFSAEDDMSANKALRDEILQFVTAGIRSSARSSSKATPFQDEITRKPQKQSISSVLDVITPYFFIKFILGLKQEVKAVEKLLMNSTMSVSDNFHRTSLIVSEVISESTLNDINRQLNYNKAVPEILEDINRPSSQRLTVVMSHGNGSEMKGAQNILTEISNARQSNRDLESYITDADRISMHSTASDNNPSMNGKVHKHFTKRLSDMMEDIGSKYSNKKIDRNQSSDTSTIAEDTTNNNQFNLQSCSELLISPFKSLFHYLFQENGVEFTEFQPYHFRRVRYSCGITDEIYIHLFSTTIKERLSEGGASGAFFFFSRGEKFIAKSCTLSEIETLQSNAAQYADYLVANPESFISRIFGAYRLKIYGNALYFFVMNNLFLNADKLMMNEKYDIKGSWVGRNAAPPRDGQSVTCTHCEQKFIYRKAKKSSRKSKLPTPSTSTSINPNSMLSNNPILNGLALEMVHTPSMARRSLNEPTTSLINENNSTYHSSSKSTISENHSILASIFNDRSKSPNRDSQENDKCPFTVNGEHEPNVILKDNDLKYKLRLPISIAVGLLNQLTSDAEFLYSIGVMDFSLLVGVHNTEYDVQASQELGTSNDTKSSSVQLPVKALLRRESAAQIGSINRSSLSYNKSDKMNKIIENNNDEYEDNNDDHNITYATQDAIKNMKQNYEKEEINNTNNIIKNDYNKLNNIDLDDPKIAVNRKLE
eukprot:gene14040-18831_t